MKFGICCAPQSFIARGGEAFEGAQHMGEVLRHAGADYVEFPVSVVEAEGDVRKFEALRGALDKQNLRSECFNSFLPPHQRIVGNDVDLNAVMNFCATALPRCKALGGEIVVLGSGAARRIPENFEREKARAQFIEFARALGLLAEDVDITISLEPLNVREDNFCNSVEDGAVLVDEIAQPRVRLLADLYHMQMDAEPLENVTAAGARLIHAHIADTGRVAPGFAETEEDFLGFFHALRAAHYDARCSIECQFTDIAAQAKPALALLKRRWHESQS